jgi:hypothetical protein
MAGQLGREIAGRRPDLGLGERPDIVGAGAEGVEQGPAVARHDGARAIGQEQGLVRIERDAVRPLDPPKPAALLAQHEQPAIGAVDMAARRRAARTDRRSRPAGRRRRCRPSPPRRPPARAGRRPPDPARAPRRARRRACGGARRWRSAAAAPGPAGDAQRLVDAMVGEAGQVDGAAALLVPRFASGDDGGEIGQASARRQGPRGGSREADRPGKPGDGGILQPDRAGSGRARSRNICSRRPRGSRRSRNGRARRPAYSP